MLLENGQESCNCKKKSCPRHGNCKECLEHHSANSKYLPYCKRKHSTILNLFKNK